jgi:hypothetical protein
MEAPFDADKTKDDLFNFSGSAGDMLSMMKAAGIVMPEAEEVGKKPLRMCTSIYLELWVLIAAPVV